MLCSLTLAPAELASHVPNPPPPGHANERLNLNCEGDWMKGGVVISDQVIIRVIKMEGPHMRVASCLCRRLIFCPTGTHMDAGI